MAEELGLEVAVEERVETVRWEYPEKTVLLHFYRCRPVAGQAAPRQGQAVAWVEPSRLGDYEFPPADRAIVAQLRAG